MGRCSCWHHRSSRPRRPSRARGAAPPQRPRGAPCSQRRGRPGGPEARLRERGDFGRRERAPLAIVAHCHSAWWVDPVRSNPQSPHKRPRAAGARGWAGARVSPAPAVISPPRAGVISPACAALPVELDAGVPVTPPGESTRKRTCGVYFCRPRTVAARPLRRACRRRGRTPAPPAPCPCATRPPARRWSPSHGCRWQRDPASAPQRCPPRGRPLHVADRPVPPLPVGAAGVGAPQRRRPIGRAAGTGGPGVRSEVPAGTDARHASFASPPSRLPAAAAVAVGGGRRPTRPWPKLGRDGATTGQRGGHPAGSPSGPTVGPRRWRSLCVGGGGGAAASDGAAASTNAAVWGDAGVGGTRRHRSAAPARRRLSISTQIVRTRAGWDTLPLCWRVCVVDARYSTVP